MRIAEELAHRLLNQYGLAVRGWSFRFDKAVKRLGAANHGRCEISMSRSAAKANDPEFVRQILLHEIAHALLPYRRNDGTVYGHGPEWRRVARELGYRGAATMGGPPTTEIGPRPRIGQMVVALDGKRGVVTKHGRTRCHFQDREGRSWSAAYAHVAPVHP